MRVRDSKTGRFAPEWKAKRWPDRFHRELEPEELPEKTENLMEELEESFFEDGFEYESDDFEITEDEPYENKHG